MLGWLRFNVPPNTLYVISGTAFYGSKDPTNSTKALTEGRLYGPKHYASISSGPE